MSEFHELKSSLIDGLQYDETRQWMRLILTNGQFRDFIQVPRTIVDEMLKAKSPGAFYRDHIRNKFPSV